MNKDIVKAELPSTMSDGKAKAGWFSTIALQEGLAKGGCLLCQALRTSVRRYLFSFLYEGMMSRDAREDFLKIGGFCQLHFWQAKAIEDECWPDGFGISILCENLLVLSIRDWEKWAQADKPPRAGLLKFRSRRKGSKSSSDPGVRCLACMMLRQAEEHYLAALEELLLESVFSERYRHSQGLCLRHLEAALKEWDSPEALKVVKATAAQIVGCLMTELREFQRKHDYQYKQEARGREWSSPQRAIEFLVGPKADGMALEEPGITAHRSD